MRSKSAHPTLYYTCTHLTGDIPVTCPAILAMPPAAGQVGAPAHPTAHIVVTRFQTSILPSASISHPSTAPGHRPSPRTSATTCQEQSTPQHLSQRHPASQAHPELHRTTAPPVVCLSLATRPFLGPLPNETFLQCNAPSSPGPAEPIVRSTCSPTRHAPGSDPKFRNLVGPFFSQLRKPLSLSQRTA
jgi:hypothetical protein